MKTMALGLLVLLVSFCTETAFAADIPDTHENRLAAARNYSEVVPLKGMMASVSEEIAKKLPENVQSSFIHFMTKTVRSEVLESAAVASMAQHFSVGELNALAAFYGSPEGRSAMKKFGAYMADVMPALRQEVLRAQQQFESQSQQNH